MIDSRMQSMASNKSSSANQSNQSLLNDAYPSSPTLETPSMFSSSSTLSNTSLFLYGRFRSHSLGKKDPLGLTSSTSSNCISNHRQNESSSNYASKSNLLTIPSAPVLNDFEPKFKSGKDASKDWYSIAQDINLNRCLPRWPIECQVIRKKVQHIRSFPTEPEVFYEVSGKEAQPRPLGEDHGVVIFEYNVTSSVSYFSRSVAAPSADSPSEYPSDLPKLPLTLRFESRFESGNLAKAIRITDSCYELYLRPDLYTSRHCQWFYFQVKNMRADMTYRFSIVNFNKPDSLYTCGMRPVLYSELEAEKHYVGWSRVGSNIRYYRNETYDEDEGCTYTLTFTLTFPHDNDTVYVAHCYPYTYSDLQDDLGAIQENESRAKVCSQKLLCNSLAGNNIYILTITAPAHQEVLKQRSVIFLSARVHPGESPSSWIMRGILHFLTGESQVAEDLRQRFIFKIVPMINPDGVIVGNTRCSLTGRDLNRQYKSVIKEAFPPVFHLKALFRRLMEEHGIVFYCDLHAHSRRFNVFLYGCENRRHSEKFLKEQVFPLMLHKNTSEKFSFDDCRFRIQRQKESTGRVVFWNMGITCSYTLEASYGGTNLGSRAYTHFNTDDYEGIGRYFCETLQDFLNPCPIKEQLRMKIISRLIKEGSTADEPSNIALTDYSSLSSADLSSTCDEDDTHCQLIKKTRRLRSRRERAKNLSQVNKALDLRKVASYVNFGSPNPFMKKSGSDRALNEKTSKGKKNEKRKFKRSLTMASIPTALLQPPRTETGFPQPDRPVSPRVLELRNSEGPETKFTIGTSDESEDDDANDDDLQKLFCPLTDSLGSPFDYGTKGEQISASSCRRVQSEILASVSKIKLLGQSRGLLSTYNSTSHLGQGDSSDGESSRCLTPIKIVTTLPEGLNKLTMGKKKIPSISVSIPSTTVQEAKPEKKKKSGKKSWEKYNRMRKACKVLEKSTDGEPPVVKAEVAEVRTLLATVDMTPQSVVKIKKRKKKKSVLTTKK